MISGADLYNSEYDSALRFLGWVLVDRSGKHFGVILNYLRDGSVSMPDNRKECLELLAEAK